METANFAKQAIGFQKTIFENNFNVVAKVHDQTEKMINSYLDQLPWMTEENKKMMQTSVDVNKKARDSFKKTIDDGFSQFEEILQEK
jgi:hypothetical protein